MKYIYLIVGLVIGVLATLSIDVQVWFKVPTDQGYVYAYQPLIATLGAITAAYIAFVGAIHKTSNEEAKKERYFFAVISGLRRNIEAIYIFCEKSDSIENNYIAYQLADCIEEMDFDCFGYDYIAQLTPEEIMYSKLIKSALRSIDTQTKDLIKVTDSYREAKKSNNNSTMNKDFFIPKFKTLKDSSNYIISLISEIENESQRKRK